jgi:lipopolysaccharide export system permease protein
LIATPAALALCLGIANLAFFDPMAAHLYEDFRTLDETLVRKLDHPFDISKAGIWAQEKHDGETTILFSPTVHEQGDSLVFDHVTLFKNANDKPEERLEAAGGQLLGGTLILHNVWHFALSTGVPVASHTESYSVPTTLTAERLQDSFAPPDTMTVGELRDFIANSKNAGFASARHRLYLQSQIASPLLYVAMVLVAAAFYLLPSPRLVGWILRGAAALFAGFALYFWNRFTFALGLSGELPIPLAAWSSTATVLLLSVSYLMHRQDG